MISSHRSDRPVLSFFGLAFGITWLVGLVVAAVLQAILPESLDRVSLLLGKYGPSIAGLIMAFVVSGPGGVSSLLRSAIRVRAAPPWYGVALLGPPLLWVAALFLFQATGGVVDWRALAALTPATVLPSLATFLFLGGGFGEELGWRGFALPMLQRRMSALRASLILGPVWAAWHFPVYLFDNGDSASPIWLFTLFVLAATAILTWLYNSTRGNVLMAVLFHASFNASESLVEGAVAKPAEITVEMWMTGLYVVLALALVLILGPASLSRRSRIGWSG